MGYSRWSWETIVRRKGRMDVVGGLGEDDGGIDGVEFFGNRRSRQIANRHWLKHKFSGWGAGEDYTSVKNPGKEEVRKYDPFNYWG